VTESSPSEGQRVLLSIETRLENVALVGVAVRGIGRLLGLSDVDANRIELCVVEAVTNVIRHSSEGNPQGTVTTQLEARADRLELIVEGRRTAGALEIELGSGAIEDRLTEESGRGLALIRSIMDRVEFRVQGDTQVLAMVKRLPRARAEPPQ